MSVAEEAHASEGGQEAGQPTSRERGVTMGQRCAGETLGTALLVFFHAGTAASDRLLRHDAGVPKMVADVAFLALADGLSLFVIIMIVGKVSGVLINPAVTLGLASARRFPWKDVPAYLVAQLIGAVIGAAAVLIVFGQLAAAVGHAGAVRLTPGTSVWQGLLVEGLGAFVLVLTISATAEDPRSPGGWAGFAIGMALAAVVFLNRAGNWSSRQSRAGIRAGPGLCARRRHGGLGRVSADVPGRADPRRCRRGHALPRARQPAGRQAGAAAHRH